MNCCSDVGAKLDAPQIRVPKYLAKKSIAATQSNVEIQIIDCLLKVIATFHCGNLGRQCMLNTYRAVLIRTSLHAKVASMSSMLLLALRLQNVLQQFVMDSPPKLL